MNNWKILSPFPADSGRPWENEPLGDWVPVFPEPQYSDDDSGPFQAALPLFEGENGKGGKFDEENKLSWDSSGLAGCKAKFR